MALDKAPNFPDLNNFLNRQVCRLDQMICKPPLELAFYELMVNHSFFDAWLSWIGICTLKEDWLVGSEIEFKQLAYL